MTGNIETRMTAEGSANDKVRSFKRKIVLGIVAVFLIGLGLLWAGVHERSRIGDISKWHNVEATVVDLSFEEVPNPDYVEYEDDEGRKRVVSDASVPRIITVIAFDYEFRVNGTSYSGSGNWEPSNVGYPLPPELPARLNSVNVYYHPETPEFNLLSHPGGHRETTLFPIVAGAVLMLLSSAFAVLFAAVERGAIGGERTPSPLQNQTRTLQGTPDQSAAFLILKPQGASSGMQIGTGLFGTVLFTLMGVVPYVGSAELNGVARFMSVAMSMAFFVLAALAAFGTVRVSMTSWIPAAVVELERPDFASARTVNGRLIQKGPARFTMLRATLFWRQSELDVTANETSRSVPSDDRTETEAVSLDRSEICETADMEVELATVESLHVARGEEFIHRFSVKLPDDASLPGISPVSGSVTRFDVWEIVVEVAVPFWPDTRQSYRVTAD